MLSATFAELLFALMEPDRGCTVREYVKASRPGCPLKDVPCAIKNTNPGAVARKDRVVLLSAVVSTAVFARR